MISCYYWKGTGKDIRGRLVLYRTIILDGVLIIGLAVIPFSVESFVLLAITDLVNIRKIVQQA